jgi:peroxiredoxin
MSTTPIAEQVSAMAQASTGQPANEIMGVFAREQAELAAMGSPESVLPVGSTLPDTALLDPYGADTSLYQALNGQTSVVVFYRGAWCPYCNLTLKTYQAELLPELSRRGVPLIAISPQAPDGSLSMQEKNELTFTVLSDSGNGLAAYLGIETGPSEEARSAQLQLGLDLTKVNADGTSSLPMPTTLIVDTDHVLQWIDVHADYTTRSEPAEILAALDIVAHRASEA